MTEGPRIDSTRWTGMDVQYLAEVRQRAARRRGKDIPPPAQFIAFLAMLLLLFAASVIGFGVPALVARGWQTGGLPLFDLYQLAFVAAIAVAGLVTPQRLKRLRKPLFCIVLLLAVAQAAWTIVAYAQARSLPAQRAQLTDFWGDRYGHYFTVMMANGRAVPVWLWLRHAPAYAAQRCFEIEELRGPWGFAWLRVSDASPLPAAGALQWQVDAATCFSRRPLEEMGQR